MKKLLVAVVLLLAVGIVVPQGLFAAGMKIGVVNIQEVIDSTDEGRKAKEKMEKTILNRKKELEAKQREYQKLEESFEKQKLILSPTALAEKQRELEAKKMELQKYFMNAQTEMQKKEFELTGDILKKIRAVVAKIGQQGGYEIILEKGNVEFYKDGFEVTKQVIAEYNKLYKKK